MSKKSAAGIVLFFVILVLVAFVVAASTLGHAATTSTQRPSSFGTLSYDKNPYTYLSGEVQGAFDINGGEGTVLRIQPTATYMLFSQDVLFCGDPRPLFEGKHNPLVLTYRVRAPRMVQGIGCHELIQVNELKPTTLQ